jgi:hypothetical protein
VVEGVCGRGGGEKGASISMIESRCDWHQQVGDTSVYVSGT